MGSVNLRLVTPKDQQSFEAGVIELVNGVSTFGSVDTITQEPCTMEGIVTRNCDAFPMEHFKHNVFKWVRKGHVKTSEHWSRNWRRAPLAWKKKDLIMWQIIENYHWDTIRQGFDWIRDMQGVPQDPLFHADSFVPA